MKYFARLGGSVFVGVVLGIGLLALAGPWLDDGISMSRLGHQLVAESRRGEAMRQRREEILESMALKRAIIAELIVGRLALTEAASQFREANAVIGNGDPELVANYRLPTTEEGLCRQILAWVGSETAVLPPEQARQIIDSVNKEFEAKFGLSSSDPWLLGEGGL